MGRRIVHIHEPFVPSNYFGDYLEDKKYVFTHHASLNNLVCYLLNILYRYIKRNGISTYVSELSKKNALTLNESPYLIPNMFSLNMNLTFKIKIRQFLFIGRDEKRKNLRLYKNYVNKYYDPKYKYIAVTNKVINNAHIKTYLSPNEKNKNNILKESDIFLALEHPRRKFWDNSYRSYKYRQYCNFQ